MDIAGERESKQRNGYRQKRWRKTEKKGEMGRVSVTMETARGITREREGESQRHRC